MAAPQVCGEVKKQKGEFSMANAVQPNFVMKKSAWSVVRFWHIFPLLLSVVITIVVFAMNNWSIPAPLDIVVLVLFGISAIPLLVMLYKIINILDETISFYNNKVVQRSGILSKHEKTNILTHVLSVSVHQTFIGRIFNYGNITVDVMGQWDIDMRGIKNPRKAKEYLEQLAANGMGMQQFLMN